MRKIKICFTWCAAALLVACAAPATPGKATIATPSEIAAQVCPPLQTTLSGLNALVGLPVKTEVDLAVITPLVAGVCAAGVTVDFASLQTLQRSALPALMDAVQASGMAVEQQNALILDLTAARLILGTVGQVDAQVSAQAEK